MVVPPDGYLLRGTGDHPTARSVAGGRRVQTGVGRTGLFYAHQHEGITPDIITLAKGLGAGLPIGACLGTRVRPDLMTPACTAALSAATRSAAAGLAVLRVLETEVLMGNADRLGKVIAHGVEELDHLKVDHVRGRGLLRGVVRPAGPGQRRPSKPPRARTPGSGQHRRARRGSGWRRRWSSPKSR